MRALFRLILLVVLVIGVAYFFGYRWGSDGPERVDISDRPAPAKTRRRERPRARQPKFTMTWRTTV